jgi:hypothetical protein
MRGLFAVIGVEELRKGALIRVVFAQENEQRGTFCVWLRLQVIFSRSRVLAGSKGVIML